MHNKQVRTRFAPSPTGYMHIGNFRTALYAYLIAKRYGGTFILRIEDTDSERYVPGATERIIDTLKKAGLFYDEGPDVGGYCQPYMQSERKHLYRPLAEELCRKGAAYYCFCPPKKKEVPTGGQTVETDPCRDLPFEDSHLRAKQGQAHVIRMKTPRDGETVVVDEVFGTITAPNKDLDDMVLLKSDSMPTYNFANVVDDHLMEITHVLRGSEYISSAPKYNLLYQAFGWEIPAYITVSPIMRDAHKKMSKRDGDPTYDDLIDLGYLPEAVLNYVALLGWSPGGEREIFSLEELCEVFDVKGISKAPALFDITKLNYFNSEYIRNMMPDEFARLAEPYILSIIKSESVETGAIPELLQARCEKLTDIPSMIDFFETLPEYDTELFEHKKSKTDIAISLDMLKAARTAFEELTDFTKDAVYDTMVQLAQDLGVKNATVMWPVRIAVAGKAVTPGGAAEICRILGREETLKRINIAIAKLET